MANVSNEPSEIRESDIVFDCPNCQKSLAIDFHGAGLIITCPDCGSRIQVPIPEGMDVSDIDSSTQDQEVRIIHMREVLSASQNRLLEVEAELQDLEHRREALERIRSENAVRFDVIAREVEVIQRSLVRIAEVLESAAESARKSAAAGGTPSA
jgi:transcription elongation factor Elf1